MTGEDLSGIVLFRGMTTDETKEALSALFAREKTYKKGGLIMRAGSVTNNMGIVLSGSVSIESVDAWGGCTILSHVPECGFFAETYALLRDEVMLVDVRANEDCRIMLLDMTRLRPGGDESEGWRRKLTANLLSISLQKNLTLSARSFHTAPRTIRRRVLSYLSHIAIREKKTQFEIPFDRRQLADYLSVERTALSKELSRMQKEGLISVKKNRFTLYDVSGFLE